MSTRAVYTQPEGAPDPDVLGVLPRRHAWHARTHELMVLMPSIDYTQARCVNREDLFLADNQQPDDEAVDEAKEMCLDCPIRQQCANWALAHEEFGIWGGMTASERARERKNLGLRVIEPMELSKYGMGDDFTSGPATPEQCKNGHYLKPDYDTVLDTWKATTGDNPSPYVKKYRVLCTQCYHDNYESESGRESMREKAHLAVASHERNGTRSTAQFKNRGV